MNDLWRLALERQALLRPATPTAGRRLVARNGTEYVDFATISYLGLEFDARCVKAFRKTAEKSGIYVYCSPLYLRPPGQMELEEAITELTGFSGAALFRDVTSLHLGVLPLLAEQHDVVLVDEFAHQSIHDSLQLVKRRQVQSFRHCSLQNLAMLLSGDRRASRRGPLVVTDGVFSMSGAIAPLSDLGRLVAEAAGALYVDDSHGFGVLGSHGEGLSSVCSCLPCPAIYVGTMSKALASPVAFVAASDATIGLIRMRAHTYLFSGNIPVPFLEAASVALEIAESEEGSALREKLGRNRDTLARGLLELGYERVLYGGGIVAVELQERESFKALGVQLHNEKIAFNPVMFPAIPRGTYRLRFCVSAGHPLSDIERLIACSHPARSRR